MTFCWKPPKDFPSFNPYDTAEQLDGIGLISMKEGTEGVSKPETWNGNHI